jgi:hypothetical protein
LVPFRAKSRLNNECRMSNFEIGVTLIEGASLILSGSLPIGNPKSEIQIKQHLKQ